MINNFNFNDFLLVFTVAIVTFGVMVYLTFWLLHRQRPKIFILTVWIFYVLIVSTGGFTVLYAIQKERQYWANFLVSTCQLFGALVQTHEHHQIEFSFSLWSTPIHPENKIWQGTLPQPDTHYSTRQLDTPQQLHFISTETNPIPLQWQAVSDSSEYELEWIDRPDNPEGWTTVYRGTETSCSFDHSGWFRVRSVKITPMDDPVYQKLSQILIDTPLSMEEIGSIYTLRDYSDDDYIFIVCPPMDVNHDGKIDPVTERLAPIGEVYSHQNSVVIPPQVRKPCITPTPVVDEWGTWFSAVVAIYRPDGTREGYVGVDYPVATWQRNIQRTQICYLFFLLFVFFLYFFGVIQMTLLHSSDMEQRQTMNTLQSAIEELTEAKKMAEVAARAKSHFLANMSHEIRTPMNAVLGLADIIGRRLLEICSSEQREDNFQLISLIEKSSSDLLTIINDILDFSKVDADQVKIEWVPTEPHQIVEDVRSVIQPRLEEKTQLSLQIEISEDVPKWVFSDPTRLRQILGNICSNAIKFSEIGTIRFFCHFIVLDNTPENQQKVQQEFGTAVNVANFDDESPITLLQFTVQDEGIGIPTEHLVTLFQPFMQVDTSLTRRFGGTGLGMSISKRLTELLGGDIIVQSEENKGSVFQITFAVNVIPQNIDTINHSGIVILSNSEKPLMGFNILVVEDGKVNQIVITKMLQDTGAQVQIAENGKICLDMIEAAAEEEFKIVLMDMQMPVMDGYEATFRLRQNGFKKPIIAVTAHALSGDCEKTLRVGCNAYISKPIDRNKLIDMILRFDLSSFSMQ